ncbi:XRE family transcriptional regulator [Trichonephila clavata]|uniref:XRE family transcriptional regulator n=1 Tax=Trichonephila clavata TaxID=2740835 RepID=A0A8X6LEH5_TRICU|nr:XRE family transcriptional regulator [Trichonephila clavata]
MTFIDDPRMPLCTLDVVLYEIAQNVRSWILKRKYTQKDLANKTGIEYYTLLRYVKGKCGIPTEKLKRIAKALSVNIKALFLGLTEYEDEDGKAENKLLRFIDECKDQESRDIVGAVVRPLSEGMQTNKEKVKKAEKIKVAKDLVKAGIAIDIILRTSGLSPEEIIQLR